MAKKELKEALSWKLTELVYVILSNTSNYFLNMTKEEEEEWERKFAADNMKRYTLDGLKKEVLTAMVVCHKEGFINIPVFPDLSDLSTED